jgi:Arc/MetJ-type ribon-helix-helix transcriptional regulator
MVATISTELEDFVQSEIANGYFASREELINAAMMQFRDRKSIWEQRVRDALAEGDDFPGEAVVLETPADFRAIAESIKSGHANVWTKGRDSHEPRDRTTESRCGCCARDLKQFFGPQD